jgi:ubiquinone/menaquinone biosynthesis C-methylase UbiE
MMLRSGRLGAAYGVVYHTTPSQGSPCSNSRWVQANMDLQAYGEQLERYNRAGQPLHTWVAGALSLSLLRAANASGLLAMMEQPRTIQDIARHLHLEEPWVRDLCQALYGLNIMDCQDEMYRLSSDLACLLAPDAPLSLADTLGIFEVLMREMEDIFTPKRTYAQLSSEDQLKVSKGKWGTPFSPLVRHAFQQLGAHMPEVMEIWNAQAKHLELGCGAGRDLLCLAISYPKVYVTGVDLNADALLHVQQDAESLGIIERVNLIQADVRTLEYQEEFHTILWSQIFFPLETRKSTLGVSYRSLKPGGYLLLPVQPELPNSTEQLRAAGKGLFLLLRLIYKYWKLNPLTTGDIRKEAEQEGFEFVRRVSVPYHLFMLLRKPLQ